MRHAQKLRKFSLALRTTQLFSQVLVGFGGAYLALLTIATFLRRKTIEPSSNNCRFAVVVPAHNEEHTILCTLRSLERLSYPHELYTIFVTADNCSDATAEVARECRCIVWERTDPTHRSKGHALRWTFERIPTEYDAVVIVDADTEVDPNLLTEFARAFDDSVALQAVDLQMVNQDAPISVASYVASALNNVLKPWGRENLNCSAGLGGNGMCLPRALLQEVPWRQFGLAEDSEYHADLVLAGKRARFVPEARVLATAPGSLKSLSSQRLRWEGGRMDTLRHYAWPLLNRAIKHRDVRSAEAFVGYVAPSFSFTVFMAVGCISLGLVCRSKGSLLTGALGILGSAGATLRGLQLVHAPARIYSYIFLLPLFVAWRTYVMLISLLRRADREWLRTERQRS